MWLGGSGVNIRHNKTGSFTWVDLLVKWDDLPSRVTKGSLYAGCIHSIYQRVGFLMSRQTLDSKSPGEGDQRVGRKGPCATSTGAVFFLQLVAVGCETSVKYLWHWRHWCPFYGVKESCLKGDTFAKLYFLVSMWNIEGVLRILISKMTWRTRGWKIFDKMMTSMTEWRNYRTWKWWYIQYILHFVKL